VLLALATALPVGALTPSASASAAAAASERVNVAPFGTAWFVNPAGARTPAAKLTDEQSDPAVAIGSSDVVELDWREPRDVESVLLRGDGFAPGKTEIAYWSHVWPDNGDGGWQRLDDPFNGGWLAVKARATRVNDGVRFDFEKLTRDENPLVTEKTAGATFRRTYKLRVRFGDRTSTLREIQAYTAAAWKEATVGLEWHPTTKRDAWNGKADVRNARVLQVDRAGNTAVVRVRYADSPERTSNDRGRLIFRDAGEGNDSFAVFIDDVIRCGGIYVRDMDAFISDASKDLRYATFKPPLPPSGDGKTIMAKVATMPEQTLERAMGAWPVKESAEAHLGVPYMRQEFTVTPSGELHLVKGSLRSSGPDLDRRPWDGGPIKYRLMTGEHRDEASKAPRSLEDGWLPVIRREWDSDGVHHRQAMLATVLRGDIADADEKLKGYEPLVLLQRIEAANLSDAERTATLWLDVSQFPDLRDDGVLALDKPSDDGPPRSGLTAVRGYFDKNGKGDAKIIVRDTKPGETPRRILRYDVQLPARSSHAVYLNIPYIELLDADELAALKTTNYDHAHSRVTDFWKQRLARGMRYDVPDDLLNRLFKTNFWHVLISIDRDPATGLYQHGAATIGYSNYGNETMMVAQSLEMRGEHRDAQRLIEPFLAGQGTRRLPGNFKSQDGVLYPSHPTPTKDPYLAQGYNMHHGWILWTLAEHARWANDPGYAKRVAPNVIAACDWITRERQATKVKNPDGSKPLEWGLAPAGDLEDVEEYLYYYSTNAYYHAGMSAAAKMLRDIGHPDAQRVARDTEAYRQDLLASVREAAATTPVVQLRDGNWVPYVPSRPYQTTHLKEGWIRESMYPALHLVPGGVLAPGDRAVSWMMNDLEDNIYMSHESGYGLKDVDKQFFDFGGFTMQPCLGANVITSLRRGEVPLFLRSFYNTLAGSLFPDVMCFTEWVPEPGKGAGPMYKTPDESMFVQWMRDMLVREEGDALLLGAGLPRAWLADGRHVEIQRAATLFGPVDMRIESHVAQDRVDVALKLPDRQKRTALRIPHPEGKSVRGVVVDGKTVADPDSGWIELPAGSRRVVVRF
jgi:hypothetical protein